MKERIKSIDSLRTLAILAVILIHTTTRTLEVTKYNLTGFPIAIFLNQIVRFAVPLFFIISGFVLELSYDEKVSYFSFIKKRFSKIFIPYVFWSIIYYLFVYTQNHDNFINVILKGDASYQLYFIPTLCIFYLVFPILHKIYNIISNKLILILLFAFQVWLLYRDYFVRPFKFADPIHIAILAHFFFIIGIIAARNKDKIISFTQKWKYIIFSGTILTGIYVFWEGFSRFLADRNYLDFYSQWRPSDLVYTLLIGLTFFFIFGKLSKFHFFEKLSKFSFLVFFIHVAILEIFWSVIGKSLFNLTNQSSITKVFFDPLFFGIVTSMSFLIAWVLHKIPKLNKLFG